MRWEELEAHSAGTYEVTRHNLTEAAETVWNDMRTVCDLPESPSIDIAYDEDLAGKQVLGYASRTMFLQGDVWVSSIFFENVDNVDITIRINPKVPNGWHWSTDGSCDIGWRYDLRTAILHELLHGVGISSSVSESSVGYSLGDHCYVTMFDSQIEGDQGKAIHNCTLRPSAVYTVGGIPLYTPQIHNSGSSFSHHNQPGEPMYYSIPPRQCLEIGPSEVAIMSALGVECRLQDTLQETLRETLREKSEDVPMSQTSSGRPLPGMWIWILCILVLLKTIRN